MESKYEGVEILIAEDSQTQAEHLRYFLEKNGFAVHVALNGRLALDYLADHLPTIVISDIMMPEMDGYELCKRIKGDDRLRSIPVILLTTLSEPEDVIKGLECGADNFITKPYNEPYLMSRVNYILLNADMRRNTTTEMGIDIYFAGKRHFITSNRIQILDMLFSTFDAAVRKSHELERTNIELKKALDRIKVLSGLIPICAMCKNIRDDKGYWHQLEAYIRDHSDAQFTHSYCPECAARIRDQKAD